MNYSYDKAIAYAKSLGTEWQADRFEAFDQLAEAHGFSQTQVDIAVQQCIIARRVVWNPKAYPLAKRIKIATKFILGIKDKGVK